MECVSFPFLPRFRRILVKYVAACVSALRVIFKAPCAKYFKHRVLNIMRRAYAKAARIFFLAAASGSPCACCLYICTRENDSCMPCLLTPSSCPSFPSFLSSKPFVLLLFLPFFRPFPFFFTFLSKNLFKKFCRCPKSSYLCTRFPQGGAHEAL